MTFKTAWGNFDKLIDALKIQGDPNYRNLVEKAIKLSITDFDYGSYKPDELRTLIGRELTRKGFNEQKQLKEDFYNSNSRGC